jgi:hypothetical protein
MSSNALAILFLPRFVRQFLRDDGRSRSDDLMNKPTMQTLAMSRQFPFLGSQATTGFLVSLAVIPALLALLDPAFCVIVLGVIRPSLAIQLPLETPFLLLVGFQFPTEGEQAGLSLFRNYRKGRRSQVKTNGGLSHLRLRFLVGNTLQGQLR